MLYQKYNALCPPLWLIGGSIIEVNNMRQNTQLKSQLTRAEQEGKIVWWGCLDPIGASTLLLKTLVLVTNSLYEPGGRVITEAMSEGVPVIAAPNGFALDLIHNWYNGFLVNHGDENELAKRMEHFIRQPFLSSALGDNARITAKKVIKEWDFIGNHLSSYEIEAYGEKTHKNPDYDDIDFFRKRKITVFPYNHKPLSKELICSFFEKNTDEFAIAGPEIYNADATSDIYHVNGNRNNYIIKHSFTRLSLGVMVSPICKHKYVRNASDVYRYEVSAYEANNSNILVAKDDFHHLLLLRELKPLIYSHDSYPEIISFLSTQYLPISDDFVQKYNDIISNAVVDSIDDIERLLNQLSVNFTYYYFDTTGTFLPYLGWKIAPHLLTYNESNFEQEQVDFLKAVCDHFARMTNKNVNNHWYEINSDVGLNHIMIDDGKMQIIDREKRTIGIPEYVIADFLLDVLLKEKQNSLAKWEELLNNEMPPNSNLNQIINSLSYKLFYHIVIEVTLWNGQPDLYLKALEVLMSKS